jgi:hypothetical protein
MAACGFARRVFDQPARPNVLVRTPHVYHYYDEPFRFADGCRCGGRNSAVEAALISTGMERACWSSRGAALSPGVVLDSPRYQKPHQSGTDRAMFDTTIGEITEEHIMLVHANIRREHWAEVCSSSSDLTPACCGCGVQLDPDTPHRHAIQKHWRQPGSLSPAPSLQARTRTGSSSRMADSTATRSSEPFSSHGPIDARCTSCLLKRCAYAPRAPAFKTSSCLRAPACSCVSRFLDSCPLFSYFLCQHALSPVHPDYTLRYTNEPRLDSSDHRPCCRH